MKNLLLIMVLISTQGCLVHVIQGIASVGVGLYQNNKINEMDEKMKALEEKKNEASLEGQAVEENE